jgi:hypothetical protein
LVKKALATSQLIFKPKKPILSSQAGFCEEWRPRLRRRLIPRLLMEAKASRWSTSLPFHQILLRWTLFCFRDVKLKLSDLSLSQGGLMTNLEGINRTSTKNESSIAFWQ